MTKEELIEVIRANPKLEGGLTGQMAERYISLAFSQVIYEALKSDFGPKPVWTRAVQSVYGNMDMFRKTYKNVTVELDSDMCTYYALYPVSIIDLPEKASGVRVYTIKGKSMDFVPVEEDAAVVFKELEVGKIDTTMGYIIRADRIEFVNFNPKIKKVTMKLIVALEDYDMDDEIHIPAGKDSDFVTLMVGFLLQQDWKKDLSNDNTNTTP